MHFQFLLTSQRVWPELPGGGAGSQMLPPTPQDPLAVRPAALRVSLARPGECWGFPFLRGITLTAPVSLSLRMGLGRFCECVSTKLRSCIPAHTQGNKQVGGLCWLNGFLFSIVSLKMSTSAPRSSFCFYCTIQVREGGQDCTQLGAVVTLEVIPAEGTNLGNHQPEMLPGNKYPIH